MPFTHPAQEPANKWTADPATRENVIASAFEWCKENSPRAAWLETRSQGISSEGIHCLCSWLEHKPNMVYVQLPWQSLTHRSSSLRGQSRIKCTSPPLSAAPALSRCFSQPFVSLPRHPNGFFPTWIMKDWGNDASAPCPGSNEIGFGLYKH